VCVCEGVRLETAVFHFEIPKFCVHVHSSVALVLKIASLGRLRKSSLIKTPQ